MGTPYIGPAPAVATDIATKGYADSVGGGGGGLVVSLATLNIGATAKLVGFDNIFDAAITPTSKIFVSWAPVSATSQNDPEFDQVTFIATPGEGNCAVKVISERPISGTFQVQYFVVA